MKSSIFTKTTTICGHQFQYSDSFEFYIDKNGNPIEALEGFRENAREKLKGLRGEFVYIYYFENISVNITTSDSFIYIGRSKSNKQKTSERFMHEIYEDNKGKDKAKQYTLTHFYEKGIRMRLEVFFVEDCREVEKTLLHKHKVTFGYLPIANGKEG